MVCSTGVVTIHGYPIPEGKTGQQTVEGIVKILEALGATRDGTFSVDCESFHSTPNIAGLAHAKTVNVLHNSSYPASSFALLDSGLCLVADNNFDGLMTNISSFYQAKKSSRMESKGPKFILGDFTVKVGSVSMGSSFRGILIEVEYGPCVIPSQCWDLLKEFMAGFMNSPRDPISYLQGKMNDIFTPVDIMMQYNEHFNGFRKQTNLSISGNPSLLNNSLNTGSQIKTDR